MVKWGEMKQERITIITGLSFPKRKVKNDEGPYPEDMKEIFIPFHEPQNFSGFFVQVSLFGRTLLLHSVS